MNPERKVLLEQLARRVLDHEPARRAEVMDLVCGSDAQLRSDLEPVVAARELERTRAGGLDTGPTRIQAPAPEPEPAPSRFGPFQLGSKIGKGGILKDPALGPVIAADLEQWLNSLGGWRSLGVIPSPIAGGDGNQEYLLAGRKT